MEKTIKIAILGAESTGKSFLAKKLSLMYKTSFVPEFARDYLSELEREYNYNDLVYIAKQQIESEKQFLLRKNKILFCDTELINIKIWFELVFGEIPDFINNYLRKKTYDFYILCNNDVKWEYDKLRVNENNRQQLFDLYEKEIIKYKFCYAVLTGKNNDRIQNAVKIVNAWIK